MSVELLVSIGLVICCVMVIISMIMRYKYKSKVNQDTCDHCYFPKHEGDTIIGQECVICKKFNSCESLGMKPFKVKS